MDNMNTTASPSQITTLRSEATNNGDPEMVAICDRALSGDDTAIAECTDVITDFEAMCAGDEEAAHRTHYEVL